MKKSILKSQFKSAIKRGTGQAQLILQAHPKLNVSKAIIKAALHNHSYDNQSEGSRADYIFELIQLSKHQAKIRRAILKALAREKKDYWALDQLFELAALYAQQGDEAAKKAIYKRFHKKTIWGAEHIGEDAIIEMDGLEGVKYVAGIKGKALQNNPEAWEDSFMLDSFQQKHPDLAVYEMLEKEAQNNPAIQTYLEAIQQSKSPRPAQERPRITYETIKAKINDNVPVHLTPTEAQFLPEQTLKKLAQDLLNETNRVRKATYLRIFNWVKFPLDYQFIFDIAKRKDKRTDRLIENAVDALGFFTDPALRLFALEVLPNAKYPGVYTNLLINHYQEGDGKLLETLVLKAGNQHKVHNLVWSYAKIYKANPTKDCQAPLLALYHKMTCGVHRKEIVEIMLQNDVLPERILQELRYDSYAETRQLFTTSL